VPLVPAVKSGFGLRNVREAWKSSRRAYKKVQEPAQTCRPNGEHSQIVGSAELNVGKYSAILTDHVMAPRNGGVMESPDLTGLAGVPGRGAFMILFLKLEHDRISAAKYHTVGCGPTIASGSMLTEMIVGRPIAECRNLTVEDLVEALDGMPPDKMHCPALAIGALKDALSKWP